MSVLYGLIALALVATTSSHAAGLYRCEVLDAMEPEGGKMVRNASTAQTIKFYNPILVDTATGLLRFGADQHEWQWKVKQKGSTANDFIGAHERGTDTITLRVWRKPVEMLITDDHLTVVVGICSELK
jgi:hypothetical protein